ncbi:MAG: tyrosine-type recombinase/integrase [Sphingomicrobium sp.]
MSKHNPANERIKREYLLYLKQAKGRNEATIDGVASSLARFEESTKCKDFGRFHREQAVAFKDKLEAAVNARTGDRLSKSTMLAVLRNLKEFFFWLAHQPGFKSHIGYHDADYFNLSEKDVAVARGRREKQIPSLEQVQHVLSVMPAETSLERRNRALIALTALTGAQVGALASFQIQHVNLKEGYIEQDARTVRTKFGKSFRTFFKPIGGEALRILAEWHRELERDHLWGPTDPLFPATEIALGGEGGFVAVGLARRAWSTSAPVREIFKRAFEAAGVPYYNPHSFRDMLVRHAFTLNLSPEQMKAWSQNLGHADVLTTFTSYGQIPTHRQGELIRESANSASAQMLSSADIAALRSVLAKVEPKDRPT